MDGQCARRAPGWDPRAPVVHVVNVGKVEDGGVERLPGPGRALAVVDGKADGPVAVGGARPGRRRGGGGVAPAAVLGRPVELRAVAEREEDKGAVGRHDHFGVVGPGLHHLRVPLVGALGRGGGGHAHAAVGGPRPERAIVDLLGWEGGRGVCDESRGRPVGKRERRVEQKSGFTRRRRSSKDEYGVTPRRRRRHCDDSPSDPTPLTDHLGHEHVVGVVSLVVVHAAAPRGCNVAAAAVVGAGRAAGGDGRRLKGQHAAIGRGPRRIAVARAAAAHCGEVWGKGACGYGRLNVGGRASEVWSTYVA